MTLQPAALTAFQDAQREAGVTIEVVESYRSCRGQRLACTNICGDATEVVAKVGRLIDLGAQRVYFQTVDMRDLDQTAYLGDEVLPQLPR